MAFGTFSTPSLPAGTIVGTQAPQKLFGDIPAEVSKIPGMVTPNTTVAMPMNVDWDAVMAARDAQKARSQAAWARAAAINNARSSAPPSSHYLPSTASQTSGMGYEYGKPGSQSPVMWAPRNLQDAQLGAWSQRQQDRAIMENRALPLIMQAHTGDPYSPGEVGGGGIYGRMWR
jgi:hypothetical protein